MKQLTSAIKPAVTGVQVHCEGSEAIEVAPFPIPPLFISQFTYIFMKNATGGILIEGKVGDDEFEEGLDPIESDIHIDKLFAFYNIRDLEESITIASAEEKEKIRQNVVKQSLMNGVVSQFTAIYRVNDGKKAPQKIIRQKAQAEENYFRSQALNSRQTRGIMNYRRAQLGSSDDEYYPKHALRRATRAPMFACYQCADSSSSSDDDSGSYSCSDVECCTKDCSLPMSDYSQGADSNSISSSDDDSGSNSCSIDNSVQSCSTKESDEIVSEIMRSQEFEGYWKNMKLVKKLANCEFEITGLSGNQLITVFALALLEVYGDESIWLLIYNKALEWLNNQNSDYDWKKAIAEAKSKIKK
jgi:hypothetical protein